MTDSRISTAVSGTPRLEGGNDVSRVLCVIAAQSVELGAELVQSQGIQDLLDERVVEVFFEDYNSGRHRCSGTKSSPKAVAMATALTPASALPVQTSYATPKWLKTTWLNPCTAVNSMGFVYRA